MSEPNLLWDVVDELRQTHAGYMRQAYGFVIDALNETVEALPAIRLADPQLRHLSGQELLAGVVRIGRREFGPFAPMVFREWGLKHGEDVGRIVFQLIDSHVLSARPEDTLQDFLGGPDLMAALEARDDWGRPWAADAPGDRIA